MQFKRYINVHEFYKDAYDVLMRHEAQNIIPLGNLLIGHAGTDKTGWRDPENWLMATVTKGDEVLLVAIMTPPHNLTLYAADNKMDIAAIDCLISGVKEFHIPGVMTQKELATYFAEAYAQSKNTSYEIAMEQRIYELTELNPSMKKESFYSLLSQKPADELHLPPSLRLLEERDMSFFPYWLEGFHAGLEAFNEAQRADDTSMKIPLNDEEHYSYHISKKNMYVLEDGGVPVSMAGLARKVQTVCALNYVYTPPYYRGCGYATSLVAGISQIALNSGFKSCALYTDLSNPTANSIYQKIGYKPICDSLLIKFT